MTCIIVHEIDTSGTALGIYHRIQIPAMNDRGWYRFATSLNGFFHSSGKKRCNRRHAMNGKLPIIGTLYTYKHEDDHLAEIAIMIKHGASFPNGISYIDHANLWDFYKFIDFDYKKRKYFDDNR